MDSNTRHYQTHTHTPGPHIYSTNTHTSDIDTKYTRLVSSSSQGTLVESDCDLLDDDIDTERDFEL